MKNYDEPIFFKNDGGLFVVVRLWSKSGKVLDELKKNINRFDCSVIRTDELKKMQDWMVAQAMETDQNMKGVYGIKAVVDERPDMYGHVVPSVDIYTIRKEHDSRYYDYGNDVVTVFFVPISGNVEMAKQVIFGNSPFDDKQKGGRK